MYINAVAVPLIRKRASLAPNTQLVLAHSVTEYLEQLKETSAAASSAPAAAAGRGGKGKKKR